MLQPNSTLINSAVSDSSDESDEFAEATYGVEEALSQLNALGISIRRPISSRLDTKVRNFMERKVSQMNNFELLASLVVERLYPDAASSLRQKLCSHMVYIHGRLKYWESHANKIAASRQPNHDSRPQQASDDSTSVLQGNEDRIQASRRPAMPVNKRYGPIERTATETEATTLPSRVSHPLLRQHDERRVRVGGASTVVTGKVEIPPPPDDNNGNICWYCHKLHSIEDYKNKMWWR